MWPKSRDISKLQTLMLNRLPVGGCPNKLHQPYSHMSKLPNTWHAMETNLVEKHYIRQADFINKLCGMTLNSINYSMVQD